MTDALTNLVTLWRERAALWESRGEAGAAAYVSPFDWKKDALEAKRCADELEAAIHETPADSTPVLCDACGRELERETRTQTDAQIVDAFIARHPDWTWAGRERPLLLAFLAWQSVGEGWGGPAAPEERLRSERKDTRIPEIHRRIVMRIQDNTPLPFSNEDQEWIAEHVEDVMRQRFDIRVIDINVEDERR